MNLIERAAQRLEQLNRAAETPPGEDTPAAAAPPPPAPPAVTVVRELDRDGRRAPRRSVSARVALDLPALTQRGLLVDGQTRSVVSQEFRALKLETMSYLKGTAPGSRGPRPLVMVASALPGEGKTYCAVNLALSLALDVDRQVLLVDGDVVRGRVLPTLGIEGARRGLLDVLAHPSTPLSEVLLRTSIPSLAVLPAGTPSPRSGELLTSAAMDRLLDELAGRYPDRVVVFDSTPLLLTMEARVLAPRMGLVLMVVEAGRTARGSVAQAFEMVKDVPKVVSVLNKRRKPQVDPLSYYGAAP